MNPGESGPATGDSDPFLIAGPPTALEVIVDQLKARADAVVLSISPVAGPPERIVARLPATVADEIRREFGGQVVIEADRPLEPFR